MLVDITSSDSIYLLCVYSNPVAFSSTLIIRDSIWYSVTLCIATMLTFLTPKFYYFLTVNVFKILVLLSLRMKPEYCGHHRLPLFISMFLMNKYEKYLAISAVNQRLKINRCVTMLLKIWLFLYDTGDAPHQFLSISKFRLQGDFVWRGTGYFLLYMVIQEHWSTSNYKYNLHWEERFILAIYSRKT